MAKIKDNGNSTNSNDFLEMQLPFSIDVTFPGDLEYIPSIRKFISELLQISNFTPRFAYRSEIIIDEICNNAVVYGCQPEDATIKLSSSFNKDHVEFTIKDPGGSKDNLEKLKKSLDVTPSITEIPNDQKGLGVEIVRMLSERMDIVIDEDNLTSVHIVRKREEELKNREPFITGTNNNEIQSDKN